MGKQGTLVFAPAVNVEGARAFVVAHGSARDRARVEGIFGRTEPERAVVKELEAFQNADGGFPAGAEAGAPSSVEATCRILAQLKDIPPLKGSPMASRAVAFLRRSQQVDGSWAESAALTAEAAFTLLTLEPEHVDPILRANRWLRARLGEVGAAQREASHTLFLAAAVWTKMLGMGAAEKRAVYEVLTERDLSAAEIAWWLSLPLETGLEARYVLLAMQQLHRLASLQREDGSWPAEGEASAETTVAALRVFRGFRII